MNVVLKKVVLPKKLQPFYVTDIIRLGNKNDGGYLVKKKDIVFSDILVSIGSLFDWSFERDFLKINKSSKILSIDGSVGFKYLNSKLWYLLKEYLKSFKKDKFKKIASTLNLYLKFSKFYKFNLIKNKMEFLESFVQLKTNKKFEREFYHNRGYSLQNMLFVDLVDMYFTENTFLSIDIEGSEYEFLHNIIQVQEKIQGMVIEFHEVNKNINEIYNFLDNFDLDLIHLHINNNGKIIDGLPEVIELTFSRKDDNVAVLKQNYLPHILDADNNPSSTSYEVTFQ